MVLKSYQQIKIFFILILILFLQGSSNGSTSDLQKADQIAREVAAWFTYTTGTMDSEHLGQCGDYATRFVLKYNEYAGANVARLVVANNPIPSGTYRIVLEKAWTPKTHFGVNMLDSREVHVWAAVKDTSVDPTYFDSWPDEFPSPLGLDEAL
jgi:hypothetical protein